MTLANWERLDLWIMVSPRGFTWGVLIKCMLSWVRGNLSQCVWHIQINFYSLYSVWWFELTRNGWSSSMMHPTTFSRIIFITLVGVSLTLGFFNLVETNTPRNFYINITVDRASMRIEHFASCVLTVCVMAYLFEYIVDAFQHLIYRLYSSYVVRTW